MMLFSHLVVLATLVAVSIALYIPTVPVQCVNAYLSGCALDSSSPKHDPNRQFLAQRHFAQTKNGLLRKRSGSNQDPAVGDALPAGSSSDLTSEGIQKDQRNQRRSEPPGTNEDPLDSEGDDDDLAGDPTMDEVRLVLKTPEEQEYYLRIWKGKKAYQTARRLVTKVQREGGEPSEEALEELETLKPFVREYSRLQRQVVRELVETGRARPETIAQQKRNRELEIKRGKETRKNWKEPQREAERARSRVKNQKNRQAELEMEARAKADDATEEEKQRWEQHVKRRRKNSTAHYERWRAQVEELQGLIASGQDTAEDRQKLAKLWAQRRKGTNPYLTAPRDGPGQGSGNPQTDENSAVIEHNRDQAGQDNSNKPLQTTTTTPPAGKNVFLSTAQAVFESMRQRFFPSSMPAAPPRRGGVFRTRPR